MSEFNINNPSCVEEQNTILSIKDQLKTLSLEERYELLSSINIEERETFIKQQQQKLKEEEDKLAQCPVSKTVKLMSVELQDLKMELQKLKNKLNENEKKLPINNMRCPYSIFKVNQGYDTGYDNEYDLCNEIEETCSSTWSWWSIIMFVIFILLVITAKPPKHCEDFFTTRM
jgi:hypothetical protein